MYDRFPTIRLIRNGVALSQCDERDSDGIVTWVEERKTIAKQVPILTNNDDTASQLTKLIQSHDVSNPSLKSAVVGLFGSKYAVNDTNDYLIIFLMSH